MPYESEAGTGTDLVIDFSVWAAIMLLVPDKADLPIILLVSFISIIIVAMESHVRKFKLTGYMNDGVNAFRPMFWATTLLLLTLFYKPYPGLEIWADHTIAFFLSTMLVFIATLLIAYRAAAQHG